MSIQSVNLLRERVIRAAQACVKELEERHPMVHTKATRELLRSVKALETETWRQDEAPALVRELVRIIEHQSADVEDRTGTLLRAKTFLGDREVNDDTTPKPVHRSKLHRPE